MEIPKSTDDCKRCYFHTKSGVCPPVTGCLLTCEEIAQDPRIQLAVLELVESLGWCVCGKMEDYDNWERKNKDTVIKMLARKGRE